MTTTNSHPELRGISVHTDLEVALENKSQSLEAWQREDDLVYLEIVRTQRIHQHGMVMVVDEDGYQRNLKWNPRAQFLSGYPLMSEGGSSYPTPILGNALFFSEIQNPMERDLVDLNRSAERWVLDQERAVEFANWLKEPTQLAFIRMTQDPQFKHWLKTRQS